MNNNNMIRSKSASKIANPTEEVEIKEERKPLKEVVRLGVCAMRKKINAYPMQQILRRIQCSEIEIIIIDDEYWDKHYKSWPAVDVLICFYSDGFPYTKAWKYVQYTQPLLINDLEKQQLLWDRTFVYQQLKRHNIPMAKHYFVKRKNTTLAEFYQAHYSALDEFEVKQVSQEIIQEISPEDRHRVIPEDRLSGKTNSSSGKIESSRRDLIRGHSNISNDSYEETPTRINSIHSSPRKLLHSAEAAQASRRVTLPDTKQYKPRRKPSNGVYRKHHTAIVEEMMSTIDYEESPVTEHEEYIMIGNNKLKRPFVEKPFDAEDHSVCIYYPQSDGGGRKMLFRKVANSCSKYESQINNIRKDGNYIYEEYLPSNGFDVKVYTVGPYYMHAEARKSPTLDGVVQRNQKGKEKRYPIFLTPEEKFIAQRVVQVFGQFVCGFDLIRSNGKSYVCDVNGFSFVKDNYLNYYDDCSFILKRVIYEKFLPHKLSKLEGNLNQFGNFMTYVPNEFKPSTSKCIESPDQLRSIVAIFRHGDRSPKQKMKLITTDPRFLSFIKPDAKEVKLKDPKSLQRLLDKTNEIIIDTKPAPLSELGVKLLQLKSVLQINGHFEGLTRKIQMKVLEKAPSEADPTKMVATKAILIMKWGGELTKKGEIAAQELGKIFRLTKYPQEEGLISLHSSYRHDLKTYSSDEGRCLKTAAAFLKGYLDLQGDLTSIINSMVKRDKKAQSKKLQSSS